MLQVVELDRNEQVCDSYGLTASLSESIAEQQWFPIVLAEFYVPSESVVEVLELFGPLWWVAPCG